MPLPSILGALPMPDATGRCWSESYLIAATNDKFGYGILRFKDPSSGQEHGFYGRASIPGDYVASTAIIIPVWTSTATTGVVRWQFSYRVVQGDDGASLDQATYQEQVKLSDNAPGAANNQLEPTPGIALTAANLVANATLQYYLTRLDDSGTDTMAADALLHDVLLQYANV